MARDITAYYPEDEQELLEDESRRKQQNLAQLLAKEPRPSRVPPQGELHSPPALREYEAKPTKEILSREQVQAGVQKQAEANKPRPQRPPQAPPPQAQPPRGTQLRPDDYQPSETSQHMRRAGTALGLIGGIGGTILSLAGLKRGNVGLAAAGTGMRKIGGLLDRGLGSREKNELAALARKQQYKKDASAADRAERNTLVQESNLQLNKARLLSKRATDREKLELDRAASRSQIELRIAQVGEAQTRTELADPDSELSKRMRPVIKIGAMKHGMSEEEAATYAKGLSANEAVKQRMKWFAEEGKTKRVGTLKGKKGQITRGDRAGTFSTGDRALDRELQATATTVMNARDYLDDADKALVEWDKEASLRAGARQLLFGDNVNKSDAQVKLEGSMIMAVQMLGKTFEGGKLTDPDYQKYLALGVDVNDKAQIAAWLRGDKAQAQMKIANLKAVAERYAKNQALAAGQLDQMTAKLDQHTDLRAQQKKATASKPKKAIEGGQRYLIRSTSTGKVTEVSGDKLKANEKSQGISWELVE